MFDLSATLNLPLIWAGIIGLAIVLYVLLDGFDLGVGILFPFAPSDKCRSRMVNSIAPFWDGNETWLVMGGGGLFAAFPLAYAILMPAFYVPLILMLIGLIFRGVAFEFQFKAEGWQRKFWQNAFHIGSLLATFMQGMILGTLVQGVRVAERAFAGGAFDWVTGFSMITGLALVFGYSLMGATWLIMKTEDATQDWARHVARYILVFVGFFFALVSLCMPFINPSIRALWFSLPTLYWLIPIPLFTLSAFLLLWRDLYSQCETRPFLLSIVLFLMGFVGLGVSLWPWIVPFNVSIWAAAATSTSQSILLVGAGLFLPIIIGYTAFSYYIFRGKSSHEALY